MRFMFLMIPGDQVEVGPELEYDAAHMAAMMKYNGELGRAGVLLALDGLHPASKGARVTFAGGKATITDGPFAEAKEVVGGYWMIQVRSRDEALEWAVRCPGREGDTIEIRQVHEFSEFPTGIQELSSGSLPDLMARNREGRSNA